MRRALLLATALLLDAPALAADPAPSFTRTSAAKSSRSYATR